MSQSRDSKDPLLSEIVWGLERDLFDDEVGQGLVRAWSAGAADKIVTNLIQNRVNRFRIRELLGDSIPFRKPRLNSGEIHLGTAIPGGDVRIPMQDFASGLLLVSQSGGGKTTFVHFLAFQLIVAGCNVWICDMYKAQIRSLQYALARQSSSIVILRPSDWRINPLQPSGVHPRTHLNTIVDLLARILGVPPRARMILNQGCQSLYDRFGIWESESKKEYPCLFDLYEWVRTKQGLNAAARDSILDRMASLLLSLTPQVAAYSRGWDYLDLAHHSIVFEMRGAAENIKQLLLEPAMFSVMQSRVEHGIPNAPLSLFTLLEDGQRFLNEDQAVSGSITPLTELAGVIRGAGLGLGILVQSVHSLSKSLIPNLSIKLFGRLGSDDDYRAMAGHLGMSQKQLSWVRKHLKTGMFAGQIATSDWREPFIFRAPNIQIPDRVNEKAVVESQKPLSSLPVIPAEKYANWRPRPIETVSQSRAKERSNSKTLNLTEAEVRFLKAILKHPGKPSSTYSKLAKLNGQRAVDARKVLVKKGLIREHRIATGKRGRTAIVLEPLKPARDLNEDREL